MERRLDDPDYRQAYDGTRERIDRIDAIIRAFDDRRIDLNLTKAELARRASVKPEAIRRLFSTANPNPTLATLVAVADALELDLRPEPRAVEARAEPGLSAASETRRRTA